MTEEAAAAKRAKVSLEAEVPEANATTMTELCRGENNHARRHRRFIDLLRACGMEKYVTIPRITVIGSQSAGKSSILEALSGITFPRGSGTCTRCPTEVRLFSSDDAWTCTISLRLEKNFSGKALDKIVIESFGPPITKLEEVQERLMMAQKALLNPSMSRKYFLNGTLSPNAFRPPLLHRNEVQFTENVICIEIKGKGVRDLAVVDLPGLIANVSETEDVKNIDLIKNLAKKEISKPDSVILLCITMNDDFQNQPSVMLAKEADPDGQRTLGVLTKPDRVEDGTFEIWRPVLEGKVHKLQHGYYVVKNPDPQQLKDVTHEKARATEVTFFQQGRWASLGASISTRLGSDRLAIKLSALLEDLIKARIPAIVSEVRMKHSEAIKELADHPAEIKQEQALATLNYLIKTFAETVKEELMDSQEEGSIRDDIFKLSIGFWKSMLENRPIFLPVTDSEVEKLISKRAVTRGFAKLVKASRFIFKDDQLNLEMQDIDFNNTFEIDGKDNAAFGTFLELASASSVKSLASGKNRQHVAAPLVLTLTSLKNYKARATRDLLPNNIPWTVKQLLIKKSITIWPSIVYDSLEKIEERILQGCRLLVGLHFDRFRAGNLEGMINSILEIHIRSKAKETKILLEQILKLQDDFTTIDAQTFLRLKGLVTGFFGEARCECTFRDVEYVRNHVQEAFTLALTDSVSEEIDLAAEARAYWQIAFGKVTDQVRSIFKTYLVEQVAKGILGQLETKLSMYDAEAPTKAKAFLQEDAESAQIRAGLVAKAATLAQGLKIINDFSTGVI